MVAPFHDGNGHLHEMPESNEHADAALKNGSAISASNNDSIGAAS